jgi:hypothetical protein
MKITFGTAVQIGWAAIGFNVVPYTMAGGSIVMGYGSNVNEYYSSGYVQPTLITPKITSTSAYSTGTNYAIQFVRPFSDPTDPTYVAITNTTMNVFLSWNDITTPSNPSSFVKHDYTFVGTLNLFDTSKNHHFVFIF